MRATKKDDPIVVTGAGRFIAGARVKDFSNLCWTRPLDALRGKMEGTVTDPRVMATILFIIMGIL